MKKYTTPDIEITAIRSADIVTMSLTVGSQSVFANSSINIDDLTDFGNGNISGF